MPKLRTRPTKERPGSTDNIAHSEAGVSKGLSAKTQNKAVAGMHNAQFM